MNLVSSTLYYHIKYGNCPDVFIPAKRPTNILSKKPFMFLSILFLTILSFVVEAQETLVGLASNGGEQSKGTVFSIKTNATAFTVTKVFSDWGKNPNGNLIKGNDGNYYGMTLSGGAYNFGTIF